MEQQKEAQEETTQTLFGFAWEFTYCLGCFWD
jgi:hypothetical protein